MKKRNLWVSILAGLMAAVMLLGLIVGLIPNANAESSASIKNRIDKLEKEDITVVVDLTGVGESKEYYPVKVIFGAGFEQLGALTKEDILVEVIRLNEEN